MSRDFYFNKWKETIKHLKELVDLDVQYQVMKAHSATLPEAVHRLTSVLGQYMFIYNEVMECSHQNLQVQKTIYIDNIVKAIVSRILELKHELEKLENNHIQFIGYGLCEAHHTICEIEMTAIPFEAGRPENIQTKLQHVLAKAKEKQEALKNRHNSEAEETVEALQSNISNQNRAMWWEAEEQTKDEHVEKEKMAEIPEEIRKTREYLATILAHEKTRQVISAMKKSRLKRDNWEKDLKGTLQPIARYEIRKRSAEIIQTVFRAYFKLKRKRIGNCKRDELLGLDFCETQKIDVQRKPAEDMLCNRTQLYPNYEKEWLARRKVLKEECLKYQRAQLCEEFREQIREWFLEWFESVQFFYDIPKDGSALIFKGDVPDPHDWLEENKALTIQKIANKKKSPHDSKFEKMEAKKQEKMLKRVEQKKLRNEALLLKKMMKNPTMHPGYNYPYSKRTNHLLEVISYYHEIWDRYDVWETFYVKEKYVHRVDAEDAIMEAKLEVLPEVDGEMRQELRKLKQALKIDYIANEEEIPVNLTKPIKGEKKKIPIKAELSEHVAELIENLVKNEIIIDYPKTKIEDFVGDPNFAGEDLRREILPAFPFNFEMRAYWWEKCREVCHGFRRILLVGPKCSGKTILVQALASLNDAVLFEIDPHKIQGGLQLAPFLKRFLLNIVTCARAVQPSVIHIKFIQKLYYTKVPSEEAEMNLPLIRTYLVQKLMKKIKNTDKITIIGTCTEPWLAKSSKLLKQFPEVLLLPDNTYSTVVQMLKDWVIHHDVIPADFNISNLAHVLQVHSFGYLKEALEKFLSADRIVKIAASGLTPMEVYDFILNDEAKNKIEYDKYLQWYTEKTTWGKREKQHLQDQRDFQAAKEKYASKNKQTAKSAPSSATPSYSVL